MTEKKNLTDKLNTLIFGDPIPLVSANDLDAIHNLDGKLNELLTLLKSQPPDSTPAVSPRETPAGESGDDLADQVRKLAKTQFKTNTLQEETLANLQKTLERQDKLLADLSQQRQQAVEAAQEELIKNLLPVLDGLDAAFGSGRRQVLKQPMPTRS